MAWVLWSRHRAVGCRGGFPGVSSRADATCASCGDLCAGTCPGLEEGSASRLGPRQAGALLAEW